MTLAARRTIELSAEATRKLRYMRDAEIERALLRALDDHEQARRPTDLVNSLSARTIAHLDRHSP